MASARHTHSLTQEPNAAQNRFYARVCDLRQGKKAAGALIYWQQPMFYLFVIICMQIRLVPFVVRVRDRGREIVTNWPLVRHIFDVYPASFFFNLFFSNISGQVPSYR